MGAVATAGPRSLEEVRETGAETFYPRHVLRDSKTALVLFAAAFHGRQDAVWMAEAGLVTTCVDTDDGRLNEMRAIYPANWWFACRDAFEYAAEARRDGISWDVVSLDPFTNLVDRCASELELWCSIARDAVILGTLTDTSLEVPDGWQVVRRMRRSGLAGGVWWTVLQPTGAGVDPSEVSACLVTRGDQPGQMRRIVETLQYDEIIVWDNSKRRDFKTAGRYQAMMDAKHDVVYFQDDDTLFVHHAELCAAYNPGGITAVYGHGETPGDYGDMPLVCGGALADRNAVMTDYLTFVATNPGAEENAYADFWVGILTPFRHVHLPFAINYEIAQHPSRLCNQPWAAAAKQRVTEGARAIRDARLA